eukprot:XP_016656464.1 PREDICTED: uncharacterized protein LOC107882531 [Acyrthosiphon pisum]
MSASIFCNRSKDDEITDNDISISLSSTGASSAINLLMADPVHGESMVTAGNSADVTNRGNPISGASPLEFTPTAILGNDTDLLHFTGRPWKSQFSEDLHPVSSTSAAEFFSRAMLGHDTALSCIRKLGKSPISDDFCLLSWKLSTAGSVIFGIDFHPNSDTLAARFVRTAMLGKDINRL